MQTLEGGETYLSGFLLSIILSIISPYIERKYNVGSSTIKIYFILILSLILAVVKFIGGDGYITSFLQIIGSAFTFHNLLSKQLGKPLENILK